MRRILVVEPDADLGERIASRLVVAGYDVRLTSDASDGVTAVGEWAPLVAIAEPMQRLPNGEYLIRAIQRRRSRLMVLALGREDSEAAVVLALGLGADDYLSVPLRMLELLARVDALQRRVDARLRGPAQLRIHGVTIDREAREVRQNDRSVQLAPREYDILEALFMRAGAVVSRLELLRLIGSVADPSQTRAIDQHVLQIRRKLGADARSGLLIQAVRGAGYRVPIDRQTRTRRSERDVDGLHEAARMLTPETCSDVSAYAPQETGSDTQLAHAESRGR